MSLAVSLLESAQLPVSDAAVADADRALGAALLGVGQDYLARVSDHWDVDLFFEVYNEPPTTGGWAEAIMAGFERRPDIPAEDSAAMLDDARKRALRRLSLDGTAQP